MNIQLIHPQPKWQDSFNDLINEAKIANEIPELGHAYRPNEDFSSMCIRLENRKQGINIHPRDVPSCLFWILDVKRGVIVGTLDMRYKITGDYFKRLGHVAYYIKPSERKKGYATQALKEVLKFYKSNGISKILVTCYKDNIASQKVIQKNAGKFESEKEDSKNPSHIIQRWWIVL